MSKLEPIGNDMNPQDYIPSDLSSKVCLVCSLPISQRMEFERELFSELDFPASSKKWGFNLQDIREHLNRCIVERNSVIPIGQLLSDLVSQLSLYMSELDSFRLVLRGERNPENMQAFVGAFKELRMCIESLRKVSTPQQLAEQIRSQAISPLVYMMVRSVLEQMKELKDYVLLRISQEDHGKMDEAFKRILKAWGETASGQQKQSLTKLAEILGVNPKELADGKF